MVGFFFPGLDSVFPVGVLRVIVWVNRVWAGGVVSVNKVKNGVNIAINVSYVYFLAGLIRL